MDQLTNDTHNKMLKVLDLLRQDLSTVRTGKAAPSLVENIVISVYGGSTRLKIMELATISVSDSQTLVITPLIHQFQTKFKKASSKPTSDSTRQQTAK